MVSKLLLRHSQRSCLSSIGKRATQWDELPRADTKSSCLPSSTKSFPLRPATSGSLGLDLATTVDCTLLDSKPTKLATGIQGPVCISEQAVGALLIGRSSATMLGLNVLVGLIDKDFHGEIHIMAQTLFPPLFIPKGTKIAQLIPLPHLAGTLQPLQEQPRGQGNFGSTGKMALLTIGLRQRPRRSVTVQYGDQTLSITALLDTGADVSIISAQKWPAHWPTCTTNATVALVGHDILAQMGMVLTSDLPF
ncbi:deoxyuridine 5'-triphosphate nucleotidohydrolase-like isoform X2 [Falco rusticolus]|uniref:deoxyuridine 5'-triphosphate nucleotidohydrolase-like isoform X1 n=1 Tax=Falco rusticolus TaxID=120794 RepID=UPI0018866C90|nr:deoxyuridine 5'-triphosphate nucleotidohydrolase-like isoform X1 [Falco rusticolus]XP_037228358.1 deoxyuridine 5'-triphosphate nucleotidohydrolase-like isoform X2 [Falco rusticolus]